MNNKYSYDSNLEKAKFYLKLRFCKNDKATKFKK